MEFLSGCISNQQCLFETGTRTEVVPAGGWSHDTDDRIFLEEVPYG